MKDTGKAELNWDISSISGLTPEEIKWLEQEQHKANVDMTIEDLAAAEGLKEKTPSSQTTDKPSASVLLWEAAFGGSRGNTELPEIPPYRGFISTFKATLFGDQEQSGAQPAGPEPKGKSN
ncbi:MAG: hypothetical protein VXZ73_01750 [Pseudomonadota bacterium]|nr:hypothetical protein [Pseudomonadota bacterium]MEC8977877.1 hypothetical protein [Pseudomonadota bacterium]